MTDVTTPEAQMATLISTVEEQGIQIAQLRRALLALGSHVVAGGPPGLKSYQIWHDDQVQSLPPPAAVKQPTSDYYLSERIAQLEAQLAEAKAAMSTPAGASTVQPVSSTVTPGVTSPATQSGSSTPVSPPTSPGSTAAAGSASTGSAPPSTGAAGK